MLGVSVTRNERLANVFYRLTLIEAYGTGVPKILKSYKGFSAQPEFEVELPAYFIRHTNKNTLAENSDDWQIHPDLHIQECDVVMQRV